MNKKVKETTILKDYFFNKKLKIIKKAVAYHHLTIVKKLPLE